MGCCQSVEVGRKSTLGKKHVSSATRENAAALRKVDCSEKSREIVCGGLRLRYAYLSQRGYYPDSPDKPNQDAYSVMERFGAPDSDDSLFSVYDGHGMYGDHCAQYARDRLPLYLKKFINKAKAKEARKPEVMKSIENAERKIQDEFDPLDYIELSKDQIQNACTRAHIECNKAMHQDVDDSLSGTTAISAYIHGRLNRVTICNVGDSRAVIGKATQANGYGQGQALKAFPLSRDQTPYRKDERIRCRKAGARILSMDQLEGLEPIHNRDDDPDNDEGDIELGEEIDEGGDPPRVWSPKGDYPGTAFTRSLGDAMAEDLGVFAEPEMLTQEIKSEDRMIVIASDGVFEFLTNQSVIDICTKFTDPLEACRAVVAESYELWLQYELRTDDITMICMFVEALTEPSAMEATYVTSSANKVDDTVALGSKAARPVRNRITKKKAQEIEKRKQNAVIDEADLVELNKEVDLDALYTHKTASEKAQIADAIKASVMFRNVTEDQRELIFGVMEPIRVKQGDWVIKQGSVGDRFYIIDEGTFEVRILGEGEEDDGTGGKLTHIYEGSGQSHPCFGELALMYSAPRSASIIARSDGSLWALHRSAFRQILAQSQGTRKELTKTIAKIPLFEGLNEKEITKLAVAFDEIAFGRGESIVEQGRLGESMFVITSGTCERVRVTKGDAKGVTLRAGEHFGQEVILDRQKYSGTVVSLQTMTGWRIKRDILINTVPVEKLRRDS
uniref:cGMP-dependent protein kinase n=1 Tax=Pseudo-nitzschia australis TaxID=44445 RepID=A0A7S4AAN9_9STRA|mmetsp:Transcript_26836/g.58869  ORF Transcript_26836/g.58869 Transcript_26836/m.58869 type:complete len:732 (-) Transcript_26836:1031-3226(-)|eukprot:CAMPEP_0168185940 /NCGR_PEP_ID=MMETSP0139_2-20121125/14133_1 /TAXON_ID=44445 /ORGANISM="Pseudo-nitzschia australis, Strain 10249 10 AB" /LENGTH=731 /DNA_ID=CAMNT_0008107847 /DNA_START=209 /DNA_END=2404 /DNA_ORIENTATION=-